LQNSPLESSCVVVALIENYSTSKPLKASEKSQILSCDPVVANERYILTPTAAFTQCYQLPELKHDHKSLQLATCHAAGITARISTSSSEKEQILSHMSPVNRKKFGATKTNAKNSTEFSIYWGADLTVLCGQLYSSH